MYFHVPVALLSFFGVMSSCQAQIFPFSNLRAFFDQKAKNGPGGQGFFKNYPVLTAAESEIKTQHVLPPTTATPSTTSRRPSLLYPHFDPEEGFREFRRPDPLPTSRSPAPLPRHKLKARLPVETHSYPGYYQDGSSNITDPKKRSPLHIPLNIAPTEAAALGHYGNFHGNAYRIPPKNHRFPSSAQATDGHMHKYREPPHQKLQPAHKTHKPPEARQRPKHPNHQNYPNHVNHFNHPNHHSDHVVEESMDSHRYRKQQHPAHHLEQEIAASGLHSGSLHGGPPSTDGDRVEFQMHGLQGPKSYKFGYDTGKGHNRQFRYEERDPHGNVKGHYGYVNEEGKLQVVNYQADPEHGFSADVSKLHL